MTLNDLYENIKFLPWKKQLIFCHFQTQEGFSINSVNQLESFLKKYKDTIYIIDQKEGVNSIFFHFFTMNKIEPYLVILKHPIMTNAYFKNLPDEIIDSYITEENNIYRYVMVNYEKNIKEFIIELPNNIENYIYILLRKRLGKLFIKSKNMYTNFSLVFTNSDRWQQFPSNTFAIMNYNDVYKSDWQVKNITSENLSKKLWKDIKKS